MPKLNSKVGKEIKKRFKEMPVISIDELNQCIGFNGAPFKTIGFAQKNKEYFGFIIDKDWKIKVPKDCEEVTETKYNSLFKIKS